MQATGMPPEIFTYDLRIVDSDILCAPERILRMNHGIAYLHIAAVLEWIVAILMPIFDADIVGVHEKIIGFINRYIADINIWAMPERFLCIRNIDIAELDTVHFTKHFRSVYLSVSHLQISRIP